MSSSFSDPLEVQGLAHFLEHMVFMGSERFPGEDEFDEFVNVQLLKVLERSKREYSGKLGKVASESLALVFGS